jgi:hypothetical protein
MKKNGCRAYVVRVVENSYRPDGEIYVFMVLHVVLVFGDGSVILNFTLQ